MSTWDQKSPQGVGVPHEGWLNKPFDLDDLYAVVARYATTRK